MKLEPIYEQIGGIIRSLRRRADQPQEALAGQLGISRATLANIETGRQRVLIHQLYAIAQALRVDLMDLLPQPAENPTTSDWTSLTFDSDLKEEQKKQLAKLIGPIDATSLQRTEEPNAKATAPKHRGRSRTRTAR